MSLRQHESRIAAEGRQWEALLQQSRSFGSTSTSAESNIAREGRALAPPRTRGWSDRPEVWIQ